MKYLLTIFTLALLLAAKGAHAQGLDLSRSNQQLRVLGAYGLSYTAKHFYRDQLGASKEMSWVLTAVTTMAVALKAKSSTSGMDASLRFFILELRRKGKPYVKKTTPNATSATRSFGCQKKWITTANPADRS